MPTRFAELSRRLLNGDPSAALSGRSGRDHAKPNRSAARPSGSRGLARRHCRLHERVVVQPPSNLTPSATRCCAAGDRRMHGRRSSAPRDGPEQPAIGPCSGRCPSDGRRTTGVARRRGRARRPGRRSGAAEPLLPSALSAGALSDRLAWAFSCTWRRICEPGRRGRASGLLLVTIDTSGRTDSCYGSDAPRGHRWPRCRACGSRERSPCAHAPRTRVSSRADALRPVCHRRRVRAASGPHAPAGWAPAGAQPAARLGLPGPQPLASPGLHPTTTGSPGDVPRPARERRATL
jgi:hypothetical protein